MNAIKGTPYLLEILSESGHKIEDLVNLIQERPIFFAKIFNFADHEKIVTEINATFKDPNDQINKISALKSSVLDNTN